jgi:RimJ/RimL family protein N-acetyltransferase
MRLVGERVVLRPYRDDDSVVLFSAWQDAEWLAPPGTSRREIEARIGERISSSGGFSDGQLIFGIDEEGRLIGEVNARQPRLGLPPGVFELGIELFEDADRARGLGRDAVALITAHLFHEEGASRVQLSTDVENVPMRSVAERLGFGFEGVMRGFMPSARGPRDYALYGMTEIDYQERKNKWTSTS